MGNGSLFVGATFIVDAREHAFLTDLYHLAESRARRTVPRGNDRARTLASIEAIEVLAAGSRARVIRQHVSEDFHSLPPFPDPLR